MERSLTDEEINELQVFLFPIFFFWSSAIDFFVYIYLMISDDQEL